jgi:hypothetical protein
LGWEGEKNMREGDDRERGRRREKEGDKEKA